MWEVRSQVSEAADTARPLFEILGIQLSNLEKLFIGLANGSIFQYLTSLTLLLNLYIYKNLELHRGENR